MALFGNNSNGDNGSTGNGASPVMPSYNYLSLLPKDNQTIRSNPTEVTIKDNMLSFNLMNSIPTGARLQDYNLTLYSVENAQSKLLKAGLSVNTMDYDTKGKSNLFMRGNVLYEQDGKTYEGSINHTISNGTQIVMEVATPNPIINSDEEFISYLLQELEYLRNRVSALENNG